MKRLTAREILAQSFREIAESKAIDKITVKDIVTNCGYSQATFYRQFRDKHDLIAWDYAQSVAGIMQKIGHDGYTWRQTLTDGVSSFAEHRDYLTNLLKHTTGADSFVRYMAEINFDALQQHVKEVSGTEELPEATMMLIRLYCLGTVNLTCEWILGKYHATPAELDAIFLNALPQPLHPYLLNR